MLQRSFDGPQPLCAPFDLGSAARNEFVRRGLFAKALAIPAHALRRGQWRLFLLPCRDTLVSALYSFRKFFLQAITAALLPLRRGHCPFSDGFSPHAVL